MFVRQALLTTCVARLSWDYIRSKDLHSKGDKTVKCDNLLAALYTDTMDANKTLKITQVMGMGGKKSFTAVKA